MKRDLFAEHAGRWQGHSSLDLITQVQLLAEALVSDNTEARQILKNWVMTKKLDAYLQRQWQDFIAACDPLPEVSLNALPSGSFAIQFKFKLCKPYLSKDEQDFYILDNPVRKDKVFKLPYVAPSSWKGSLRSAIRFARNIVRLFGPVKGEEDEEAFCQGRLHFFPTFFTQMDLEVINPHDRQKGAGKNPIFIESVPAGAQGTFTVLYVPFDRIGQDEGETKRQVAKDLKLVAQGVQDMFTQYGFGAKTSSGFGVADILSGTLTLRIEDAVTLIKPTPSRGETHLPQYLEAPDRLKAEFLTPQGTLKSEAEYQAFLEGRGKQFTKKQRQLYEKAKKWWQGQQQKAKPMPQELQPEPEPSPQPRWWQREFQGSQGLDHVIHEGCARLESEGTP